jgi:hypothetical protein
VALDLCRDRADKMDLASRDPRKAAKTRQDLRKGGTV